MQKTLSFTLNKKKYVSRPFDFEAFCKVNEKHIAEGDRGIYRCTEEAVSYLFEGTEATDDVLKSADTVDMAKMCKKVWDFYAEALEEIGKNE